MYKTTTKILNSIKLHTHVFVVQSTHMRADERKTCSLVYHLLWWERNTAANCTLRSNLTVLCCCWQIWLAQHAAYYSPLYNVSYWGQGNSGDALLPVTFRPMLSAFSDSFSLQLTTLCRESEIQMALG